MFDLQGKVAVVTGAAGILCSEISKALGKVGVKVVLADFAYEKAKELSNQIPNSYPVFCNVLDKECLENVYNSADENDIILLIGAQGMDPAESILNTII